MDVARAERCFPVLRAARALIAQRSGAGGHPLPELPGERVQRRVLAPPAPPGPST
ncbi:hypothetical protein LT493_37615 [Streptomyces tricolor]|nr:hypothetical protein [Streptomyces tricolor]